MGSLVISKHDWIICNWCYHFVVGDNEDWGEKEDLLSY